MKIMSRFLLFAFALLLAGACTEDPDPFVNPPAVSIAQEDPFDFGQVTVAAGSTIMIKVSAAAGDNQMNTITVLEDGFAITDFSNRILVDGAAAAANPILLFGAEKDAFTKIFTITVHDDASTRTYAIQITDDNGTADQTTIDVSTITSPLSLTADATGCAWNLSGQSLFCINLTGTKGGSELNTLTVAQNGVDITDATRLRWGASDIGSAFATNPLTLAGTDRDGFSTVIWVSSHSVGTATYTYTLTDDSGASEEVSATVTVGTPVTEITGALLNQSGPSGTGGCDLNTGASVGSGDPSAEIRDEGSDFSQPAATNWVQQISAVNGSTMRTIGTTPENFDYDAVSLADEIVAAFDGGVALPNSGFASGNPATNTVNQDDVFVIRNAAGEHFLIKITNIIVTPDLGDNGDQYEFSIKF